MVDRKKKKARFGWRFFRTLIVIVLGAVAIAAICGWVWYRDVMREVPDVPDIESLYPDFPSRVQTVDGHRIGGVAHTGPSHRGEIPPIVAAAFLAAEDADFFFHEAYSLRGIARAAIENYRGKKKKQGASTITQQVARRFLTRKKTYRRKVTELLLARRIEQSYSKTDILDVYLESVFLGYRAEGVTQAAWRYFGKAPSQLTLAQAATLAGIAPAPSKYNPIASKELAARERKRVLRRMRELAMITESQESEANAEPMKGGVGELAPSDPSLYRSAIKRLSEIDEEAWHSGGYTVTTPSNPDAGYELALALQRGVDALERRQGYHGPVASTDRPEELAQHLATQTGVFRLAVVRDVSKTVVRVWGEESTITLRENTWAEPPATKRHFKRPATLRDFRKVLREGDVIWIEKRADDVKLAAALKFEGAALFIESQTGRPIGSVGAIDPTHDQFHRVWQGCRQPGSVFKPVVYAEAFSQGLSPATMVSDMPVELDTKRGGVWRPRNADRDFKGYITIARALASSRNVPVARLMDHLGAKRVIERARKLGIHSPIDASSSASLGANCTKPWEVARMYAPFQREGWSVEVQEYDHIVKNTDELVEDSAIFSWPSWDLFKTTRRMLRVEKSGRAVSQQVAHVMMEQLRFVATRGTAHDLPSDWQVAGKTGTTNQYDAWFVGLDGRLTTAIWVGSDKNERPLGSGEHGATVALPIFETAYKPYVRTEPLIGDVPVGVERFRIDPQTGLLSPPGEFGLDYAFVVGTEPTEFAPNLGAKQSQHIDELIYDF